MKEFILIMALFLCFGLSSTAYSTQVTVTLEELDDMTRNSILDARAKKNAGIGMLSDADPGKIKAWSELFTTTLKDVCSTLNVEVNEFVRTPVGLLTAGLITYKVLGADVRGVVFGLGLWFSVVPIILWLFIKFNIPKKVKVYDVKENKKFLKEVKYVPRVSNITQGGTDYTNEWKIGVAIVCAIMFVIVTLVTGVYVAG